MTRSLLLPLVLSSAVANLQTAPKGYAPRNDGHYGFNLCDLTNERMLVGEISMSQDSTLFAGFSSSTASMGKFAAGRTPDGVRRALLSFDMSSVDWPTDAKVACAEVRLAVDTTASVSAPYTNGMTLHKVTKAWTTNGITNLDGINGDTAQEGDATWQYSSYPTEEWHTPGGDFWSDSLSRESVVSSADGIEYAYFGSTKRMHAIVSEWIASPENNHGMLIKSDERADDPIAFNVYYGMEHDPKLIPKLVVVYTAPSLGYDHEKHPNHHRPSNIPDLNGYLDTDAGNNSPTGNQSPDLSGNPNEGNSLTGNKPDLNGGFDEDSNLLQDGPSDNIPTPSADNTDGTTDSPKPPVGDDTHFDNNKRTFPPTNNDARGQTHTSTNDMRKSSSNQSYIGVVATCAVVSVLLVLVSALYLIRGASQPQQRMTADEVLGNDLSLDTDKELV